jgi:UDP-N-acetylmuramyl tripeptide synthase
MTSPGNRRDTHYAEMAATAAGHYDRFICSRWGDNPRGRGPLEVQKFLQKGLIANGVDADSIRVAETENDAISKVLDMAEPGDVVAICCKNVDEAWQQVENYQSSFE